MVVISSDRIMVIAGVGYGWAKFNRSWRGCCRVRVILSLVASVIFLHVLALRFFDVVETNKCRETRHAGIMVAEAV